MATSPAGELGSGITPGAATLARAHPNEGTRKDFPTVGDIIVFLMTAHEMDHLGELAAWRRALGLAAPARA